VSLSLLSHHFGSKLGLLDAVVDSLQAASSAHLVELQTSIDRASDLQALVKAWVRYARDVFGHRAGMPYLRLLLRLQSDPEVASEVRFSLDKSESFLRRRLTQLFPLAPSQAVDIAWTATAGALYAVLIDSDPFGAAVASTTSQGAWLERYLASGLAELLEDGSDAT
jgi:AcrR family transcriptional regulator